MSKENKAKFVKEILNIVDNDAVKVSKNNMESNISQLLVSLLDFNQKVIIEKESIKNIKTKDSIEYENVLENLNLESIKLINSLRSYIKYVK